jgi:hypothetical protein
MSVDDQVWLQPDSPDHRLEIYTPNDAGSADALRILAHQSRGNTEPVSGRVGDSA